MMDGVKSGAIKTIIVKDHSRLGRNRLIIGTLLEEEFEKCGTRYIAIMDNIDTEKGLSDWVPVSDLFNEWHAKNTSQKVRAVMQSKGNAGLPLTTNPPFGYRKNPVGGKYWIVDEPAAEVVRRIFALCMDGNGPTQIADILVNDNVPTPSEYWRSIGVPTSARLVSKPCGWSARTVADILGRMEYIGHTVNFRTHVKSFKNKVKVDNDPSDWKIFEDTHQAIMDVAVWERVQEIRKGKIRRQKIGKVSLFSGLLECADCHQKLYYATSRSFSANQDHFVCSGYRTAGNCTAHYIREITLAGLVLEHLQRILAYVKQFEDLFVKSVSNKSTEEHAKEISVKRKTVEQHDRRIAELDVLFQRIYEDNANSKISDERFQKMAAAYESEQTELQSASDKLSAELAEEKQSVISVERFLSIVRRYTEVKELSPTVLHDFIEKVVVHAPDRSSGKRKQRVEIFYNAVGIIDVPSQDEMVEYLKVRKQRRAAKQLQPSKTA
jgi:hypothetical protein